VHSEQEAESDDLVPHQPQLLETITINNQQHWDQVIAAMTDVVHSARGTARRIGKDSPYRIAGKTGTAQVFGLKEEEKYDAEAIAEKLRDHALFIAFAPVEEPRIAVAVIVENGGGGGSVAAPIARKIMDAYLQGPAT
jgi:penicillin-binding protein 2